MLKLIRNEFSKITRQKYIYIILIIITLFTILFTFLDKKFTNEVNNQYLASGDVEFLLEEMKDAENEIKKTNKKEAKIKKEEIWRDAKSRVDKAEEYKKMDEDWQKEVLQSQIFTSGIFEKKAELDLEIRLLELDGKEAEAGSIKNSEEYKKISDEIEANVSNIKKLDQKEYVKTTLAKTNERLNEINNISPEMQNMFFEEKANLERLKEELDLRVKENIYYDNRELSKAVSGYIETKEIVSAMKNEPNKKLNKQEKNRLERLEKELQVNKYIIDTKEEIEKSGTTYSMLLNFDNNAKFFVLLIAISYAATMMGEEFNKGTIKGLLTTPNSRMKIFFSKFISVLIMTIFSYIAVFTILLLVGGAFNGFDSLKWSVLVFKESGTQMLVYPIFKFVLLKILVTIPATLIYTSIAFLAATLFANTSLGITVGLVSNIAAQILNSILKAIASMKNHSWIKYIPTLNWDWNFMLGQTHLDLQYLGGPMMGEKIITNPQTAIAITALSLLIIVLSAGLIFKKKDIKNV